MPIQYESKFSPLFYTVSISEESFTTDAAASSAFSIDQIIAGDPAIWVDSTTESQPLRKKLVFADFTKNNYSFFKQEQVAQKLIQLLNEGFSIYAEENNEVKLITLDSVYQFLTPEKVRPRIRDEDEFITSMSKNTQTSPEQLFILDVYWIQELLYQEEKLQAHYRLNDEDLSIIDEAELLLLTDCIKRKNLGLKINIDKQNNSIEELTNRIKVTFPQADFNPYYKTFQAQELSLAIIEENNDWNLLKSLIIENNISKDQLDLLNDLIKKIPHGLEALILNDVMSQKLSGVINSQTLALVKRLEINLMTMSAARLMALLKTAPLLKMISFANANLQGDLSSSAIDLSNLKVLEFISTDYSSKNLAILIKASSMLEKLALSDTTLRGDFFLAPDDLKHLTELTFSNAYMNSSVFTMLLQKSFHLETLNLSGYMDAKENFSLAPDSLPFLKKLNLSDIYVSTSMINELLKASSQLENLNLSKCMGVRGDFSLEPDSLSDLKELTVSNSSVSIEILNVLLKASSQLEKLNLSEYITIKGDFSLETDSLANLKELNLSDSNVSIEMLNVLLKACPRIEILNLTGFKELDDDYLLSLSTDSLQYLKKIILQDSQLSPESLIQLLDCVTDLHEITFYAPEVITQYYDLIKQENTAMYEWKSSKELSTALKKYIQTEEKLIEKKNKFFGKPTPKFKPQDRNPFPSPDLSDPLHHANHHNSPIQDQKFNNSMPTDPTHSLNDDRAPIQSPDLSDPLHHAHNHNSPIQDQNFNDSMPMDPTHNPNDHRTPIQDSEFNFTGSNRTLDQSMLIEKLSQYMTLKKKHPQSIQKIQKGICNALSHFFLKKGDIHLTSFLQEARAWDGQEETLLPLLRLREDFDRLLNQYVPLYQGIGFPSFRYSLSHPLEILSEKFFIGDALPSLLSQQKTDYIFSNPWHAIGAHYESTSQSWSLYDPNYVDGIKRNLDNETASAAIYRALGPLISCTINDNTPLTANIEQPMSDPNIFIKEGGLIILISISNVEQLLPTLEAANYNLDSLQGLCLFDLDNRPLWTTCIKSNHQKIKMLTARLLEEYKRLDPEHAEQKLAEGIKSMHQQKKEQSFDNHVLLESLAETDRLLKRDLETISHASDTHFISSEPLLTQLRTPIDEQHQKKGSFDDHVLLESLAETNPLLKKDLDIMSHTSDTHFISSEPLLTQLRTPIDTQHQHAFNLWDKSSIKHESLLQYIQHRLSHADDHKHLIDCQSIAQLETLRACFFQQAACIQHRIFYVDKPAHLGCSGAFIEREHGEDGSIKGVMKKGPGGPLYNFLQACHNQNTSSSILINYSNFKAEDMIRFNSMLDATAQIDKVDLPSTVRIIGLRNINNPKCYQGNDFTSRFNTISLCPFDLDVLQETKTKQQKHLPPAIKSITPPSSPSEPYVLDFFNARDWQEQLLGSWVINGDQLTFERSEFMKAIEDDRCHIELKNLPVTQEVFDQFLQLLHEGHIYHAGEQVHLQKDLTIQLSSGYDTLESLKAKIQQSTEQHQESHPINPTLFESFFSNYIIQDGKIFKQAGILEQQPENSRLSLQLTRDLSNHQWAKLLTICDQKNINLTVIEPPTVEKKVFMSPDAHEEKTIVILSTDPYTTVAQYMAQPEKDYHLIDVSEFSAADLISTIDRSFNQESLTFTFEEKIGPLKTLLQEGTNILLKGILSEKLNDHLAAFLFNEQKNINEKRGSLVIITDFQTPIAPILHPYTHEVTVEEKQDFLINKESLHPHIAVESLSMLQAKERMEEEKDPWVGMRRLDRTRMEQEILSLATAKEDADNFWQERVASFNEALNKFPFVFLAGHSGVGKSTFMEREVSTKATLYRNEAEIKLWATDQDSNGKQKILFIDEANLTSKNWSQFEGLLYKPRRILIDRTLHELTSVHKVVFAGNPLNYGDERQLPSLFERHGCSVLFHELPRSFLYESILKPVLPRDHPHSSEWEKACNYLLDLYQFIDQDCRSSQEVLISARELQMMGLLLAQDAFLNPNTSIINLAQRVGYNLAQGLIPAKNKKDFEHQFHLGETSIVYELEHNLSHTPVERHSFFTPSRQHSINLLNDFLMLRKRRKEALTLSDQQLSGGLGGIILEGEPGIGKTELVIHLLRQHEYKEEKNLDRLSQHPNPFYIMPVSMQLKEKEALLLKAFDEGAVVVIDEINSAPMMERLLNELLMGKYQGRDALKPGFMIIGTQNPVSMGGRRSMSTALSRRTLTALVKEYSAKEMQDIVSSKGINQLEAQLIVDSYVKAQRYAISKKLSPVPCMRDLVNYVDTLLKARSRKEMSYLNEDNSSPAILFSSQISTLHPNSSPKLINRIGH